jgi:hypothetical protein
MTDEKKHRHESPEEIAEILSVVSDKVPGLIKGLVNAVYSEDSARGMAKAAAAYYTELKAGGIPDDVALRMTQDYVSIFSKIGDIVRQAQKQNSSSEEIEKAVKERIKRELEKE